MSSKTTSWSLFASKATNIKFSNVSMLQRLHNVYARVQIHVDGGVHKVKNSPSVLSKEYVDYKVY